MASYVVYFTFTDQGIRNIKESPARVQAAKQIFQRHGAVVKSFYAVIGQPHDTFFTLEAPNDDAVVKGAMAVASLGNVRTQTARLYNEEEFRNITAALP